MERNTKLNIYMGSIGLTIADGTYMIAPAGYIGVIGCTVADSMPMLAKAGYM